MYKQEICIMKKQPLEIHTARLCLRQITAEDAPILVELRSEPESYRFFRAPHRLTLVEHICWYEEKYLADKNRFDWLALREETPIGSFSLKRLQEDVACAEISYLLAPEMRCNGYAAVAVNALLQWGVERWKIRQGIAEIHCDNIASRRFAERMHFSFWKEDPPFICYRKNL